MTVNSVEEKIIAAAEHKKNVDQVVIQAGLFDAKSTKSEREDYLKSVFEDADFGKTDGGDSEVAEVDKEEVDVPDDEMLNQMLQRSMEEFEIFQKMDADRLALEGGKSRLMKVEELPRSFLQSDEDVDKMLREARGAGVAHEKRVSQAPKRLDEAELLGLDKREEKKEMPTTTRQPEVPPAPVQLPLQPPAPTLIPEPFLPQFQQPVPAPRMEAIPPQQPPIFAIPPPQIPTIAEMFPNLPPPILSAPNLQPSPIAPPTIPQMPPMAPKFDSVDIRQPFKKRKLDLARGSTHFGPRPIAETNPLPAITPPVLQTAPIPPPEIAAKPVSQMEKMETFATAVESMVPVKRKRGRPRKPRPGEVGHVPAAPATAPAPPKAAAPKPPATTEPPVKRKRGRPPKDPNAPPKPPGSTKPRKTPKPTPTESRILRKRTKTPEYVERDDDSLDGKDNAGDNDHYSPTASDIEQDAASVSPQPLREEFEAEFGSGLSFEQRDESPVDTDQLRKLMMKLYKYLVRQTSPDGRKLSKHLLKTKPKKELRSTFEGPSSFKVIKKKIKTGSEYSAWDQLEDDISWFLNVASDTSAVSQFFPKADAGFLEQVAADAAALQSIFPSALSDAKEGLLNLPTNLDDEEDAADSGEEEEPVVKKGLKLKIKLGG